MVDIAFCTYLIKSLCNNAAKICPAHNESTSGAMKICTVLSPCDGKKREVGRGLKLGRYVMLVCIASGFLERDTAQRPARHGREQQGAGMHASECRHVLQL